MALFRRRGPSSGDQVVADPAFPFLTADQADRVRGLVHRAFLDAGVPMTIEAVVATDAWGRAFDLAPVMTACHADDRGPTAWAHVVGAHVGSVLPPPEQEAAPLPDLPLDDLLAAVHPLLLHARDVPWDAAAPVEVAPHLVEVLQLLVPDRPTGADDPDAHDDAPELDPVDEAVTGKPPSRIRVLSTSEVERLGSPAHLRERARDNLAGVVPQWHVVARDGGRIDVVTTERPLAAALSLLLPRLPARLEKATGPVDPARGVFFAAPFAGQLDLHVVRDASARTSLAQLALFAATGFTGADDQVSPDVYWWHDGRVDRLTHLTPEGVAVVNRPDLEVVLEALEHQTAAGPAPSAPGQVPLATGR